MFTQRYVLVTFFEDEDGELSDPVCTYYDFDELDKALAEFEKTKGWLDIQLIDRLTGKTVRQMESCDYTVPIVCPDPADWWKPPGWELEH